MKAGAEDEFSGNLVKDLTGLVSSLTATGLFLFPVLLNNQKAAERKAGRAEPCTVSSLTEARSAHFEPGPN